MSGVHSEKDFESLKQAGDHILRDRLREHTNKAKYLKSAVVYIHLTPGKEDAPEPEVIVETALAEANKAEALYHIQQAKRFEQAIVALGDTTYEESN